MPQMAPYNWLMLMIMFTLILMYLIINIHYFFKIMHMNNKKMKISKNLYFWMW